MNRSNVEVVQADLERIDHQQAVLALTAAYALDPFGNGGPLPEGTLNRLIKGLKNLPTTMIFLAYLDGHAVGIATCFQGFSTFAALPLLNVHDFAVLPEFRGRGIGAQVLRHVEAKAKELGCCKLTLEVLEDNVKARSAYHKCGFAQASSGSANGGALFYSKKI